MADAPDISDYRIQLGNALWRLAHLCFEAGRHREAEQAARQAMIVLEVCVEQSPGNMGARESLAVAVTLLGHIHLQTGETSIALVEAKRGRTLYEKLPLQTLLDPWFRPWNLMSLGRLHDRAGPRDESKKYWQLAVAEGELVVKGAPKRLDYRSNLALYLMEFGESSAAAKRTAEAERDLGRAFELYGAILKEAPERSLDRRHLAGCAKPRFFPLRTGSLGRSRALLRNRVPWL